MKMCHICYDLRVLCESYSCIRLYIVHKLDKMRAHLRNLVSVCPLCCLNSVKYKSHRPRIHDSWLRQEKKLMVVQDKSGHWKMKKNCFAKEKNKFLKLHEKRMKNETLREVPQGVRWIRTENGKDIFVRSNGDNIEKGEKRAEIAKRIRLAATSSWESCEKYEWKKHETTKIDHLNGKTK